VRYCSADCQQAHWPEHCKECAGVQQQGPPDDAYNISWIIYHHGNSHGALLISQPTTCLVFLALL
jgi:hypothetical protein